MKSKLTEIQTYSGEYFNYAKFTKNDLYIEDISNALDNICRYNGHCIKFYSVAQHLCLVHDIAKVHLQKTIKPDMDEKKLLFHCLIHDVGEAYLTDIPRPLKAYFSHSVDFENFMTNYNLLEDKIVNEFSKIFKMKPLTDDEHKIVKYYDNWALLIEQKNVMRKTLKEWSIDNDYDSVPIKTRPYFRTWFRKDWAGEFRSRLENFL